jgi:decaprenyl-phosphate phosphoribosyltransferase
LKPDPDVSDAGEVIPAASSTSLIGALVRTARPKQWIKNVLVAAAPGAAGVLGERTALGRTALYTHVLKTIAVLDIAGVASGYIIRAVAGAVATQVPLSNWFAIVTSFGSLFMVAGRRSAEHLDAGVEPALHRSTLAKYSADYLRYVRGVSSAIAITAYCLWAFERSGIGTRVPWFEFSILPFVLAILRYALLIDEGKGGTPEDIVFSDRAMPVLGIVWAALVTAGIYIR